MDASFIEPYRERYPRAAGVVGELVAKVPTLLGPLLAYQDRTHGERFWKEAERVLELSDGLGAGAARTLVDYTGSYMKAQAAYLATGKYAQADFDEAYRAIYGNPQVMEGSYLKGLLLSLAFWPLHFDIHGIFASAFLPLIGGRGLEIGFGHGYYLAEALRAGASVQGYDVSPSSVAFAGKLLRADGADPARWALGLHDVRKPLPEPDGAFGFGIFAEVLEHIPDRRGALAELHRVLAPGAPAFLTTVLYSNHVDHLTQFADQGEVDRMIAGAGFEVVSAHPLPVAAYLPETKDPTVGLVYVCRNGTNRLAM